MSQGGQTPRPPAGCERSSGSYVSSRACGHTMAKTRSSTASGSRAAGACFESSSSSWSGPAAAAETGPGPAPGSGSGSGPGSAGGAEAGPSRPRLRRRPRRADRRPDFLVVPASGCRCWSPRLKTFLILARREAGRIFFFMTKETGEKKKKRGRPDEKGAGYIIKLGRLPTSNGCRFAAPVEGARLEQLRGLGFWLVPAFVVPVPLLRHSSRGNGWCFGRGLVGWLMLALLGRAGR